jgi:hypothetical protein
MLVILTEGGLTKVGLASTAYRANRSQLLSLDGHLHRRDLVPRARKGGDGGSINIRLHRHLAIEVIGNRRTLGFNLRLPTQLFVLHPWLSLELWYAVSFPRLSIYQLTRCSRL